MNDAGLQEAIRATGGMTELARRIGMPQPSISNGTRVPAERALSVEAATDIARTVLRPDLYAEEDMRDIDEIDLARAQEYALLANLLLRAPDAALLKRLSGLRGDPTPLGVAHIALADAASSADASKIEREFFNLFIGVGRGELVPYGSYYLTGFLHERPLARLREDLIAFGIERAEGQYEPEDHAGILCEIMSGIVAGQFDVPPGSDRNLYERHLSPWLDRFFADLENAEGANFYRRVGTVGRIFLEIEAKAFALPE